MSEINRPGERAMEQISRLINVAKLLPSPLACGAHTFFTAHTELVQAAASAEEAVAAALAAASPVLVGQEGAPVTLRALHAANAARQTEWCKGGDAEPDLAFRGNELAGETGEACNVIKKLERERHGWRGSRATLNDLAEELADVVICADLCAITAGIDLSAAVVAKFNATSAKQGLATMLSADEAPPPAPLSAGTQGETKPRQLTPGCLSVVSPCGHQAKDPDTICDLCEQAFEKYRAGIQDRATPSHHSTGAAEVSVLAQEVLAVVKGYREARARYGATSQEAASARGHLYDFEEKCRAMLSARPQAPVSGGGQGATLTDPGISADERRARVTALGDAKARERAALTTKEGKP